MSTHPAIDPSLQHLLATVRLDDFILAGSSSPEQRVPGVPYKHSPEAISIDPRIKQLSYSALLTLHSCPRKFQLERLKYKGELSNDPLKQLTFTFGSAVGDGAQKLFAGVPLPNVMLDVLAHWKGDIFEEDKKRKKSFMLAFQALEQLDAMLKAGFLDDWEVLEYDSKPALELSYRITLRDGFKLRGFVDAVLRHKTTGEVRILEIKTDSARELNPLKYKNSSQGVGYAVVLDTVAPGVSSYEVLYLVYGTSSGIWQPMPFAKTSLQRAFWLQDISYDVQNIETYEANGYYPMRGESCTKFGSDCPYSQTCVLDPELNAPPYVAELHLDQTAYTLELKFSDLVEQQLKENQT